MEEKIYFKPASYGKGMKNQLPTAIHDGIDKKNKDHRFRNLFLFGLFLLIVVFILLWLLRGNTTTSGRFPESVRNESLECVSTDLIYDKIQSIISDKREIKITAIFKSGEELSTINLRYQLGFIDNSEAIRAEALSHAELNTGLQQSGFSSGMFSNKFTIIDNSLTITLHAAKNDINELTKTYFMIGANQEDPLRTLQEYRKLYEERGFICKTSKE